MSTSQIASKRKKKFTGGNASKRHRDRVNIEFNNLAKLLPFPENVIAKLDKSSILRLAVSYIRAKSFFKDALPLDDDRSERGSTSPRNGESIYKGILEETCLTEFFLQALDGFLIVVTEDLKVLYVSDSVRDYLGYCQAGIIHESFLQFIHWADKKNIANALVFNGDKTESPKNGAKEHSPENSNDFTGKNGKTSYDKEMEQANGLFANSNLNNRVESRRFVCRMKCAFSCSSRFYTAFRAFQFSGHVRRSTIQEGKELRTLNTLIAFGAPSASSKFDPLDLVSDVFDETRAPCPDDIDLEGANMKMIGLHIEPRLRPHIAPIPIPQSEAEGRQTAPQQYPCNRRYNVNMRQDPSCNGVFNQPARIGSAFKLLNDYYQNNGRCSAGWGPRSSSLSNSPISDASSPRGIKRASSADMSPDTCDIQSSMKNPRLEDPYYRDNQNGYNTVQFDDIHSSARILMQLQATQKRLDGRRHSLKDYESDCSSDDKSEISVSSADINSHTFPNTTSPRGFMARPESMPGFCRTSNTPHDSKVCVSLNGYTHGERERFLNAVNAERRSAFAAEYRDNRGVPNDLGTRAYEYTANNRAQSNSGGVLTPRTLPIEPSSRRLSPPSLNSRVTSSRISPATLSPTRISPLSTSPSRLSPPKKDPNRGFHISTILGLEEKTESRAFVAGQRESGETEDRRKGFSARNGVHEDLKNLRLASDNSRPTQNIQRKDIDTFNITNDASNLDDIKTSFAHILQGLTATITQSIDKSIDTIFKSSESKDSLSQACKF